MKASWNVWHESFLLVIVKILDLLYRIQKHTGVFRILMRQRRPKLGKHLVNIEKFLSYYYLVEMAQLVAECRSTVRVVSGSHPGRTTTRGLIVTEEKVLPFYLLLEMVRH